MFKASNQRQPKENFSVDGRSKVQSFLQHWCGQYALKSILYLYRALIEQVPTGSSSPTCLVPTVNKNIMYVLRNCWVPSKPQVAKVPLGYGRIATDDVPDQCFFGYGWGWGLGVTGN